MYLYFWFIDITIYEYFWDISEYAHHQTENSTVILTYMPLVPQNRKRYLSLMFSNQ